MYSWFRLSAFIAAFITLCGISDAQLVTISGQISAGEVRIFVRDSVYRINGRYAVAGTLIIEPGTTVEFVANGQLIDSVGGRIIADGRARAVYNNQPYNGVARPALAQCGTGGFTYDYSDPAYFMSNTSTTIVLRQTQIEPTIHSSKSDITFNVVLDTVLRRIENLPPLPVDANGRTYARWPNSLNPDPGAPPQCQIPAGFYGLPGNPPTVVNGVNMYGTKFLVSYEQALMWMNARLGFVGLDPTIRTRPWTRMNFQSPDVGGPGRDRVLFLGRAVNNFSREWGHIVVLPGARTAFFRDCDFQNFKKDTTVSRQPVYQIAVAGDPTTPGTLNYNMNQILNGSGGALSVLSSRTWLVGCTFSRNMARYHGGALQFTQAPVGPAANNQYPATLTAGSTANNQYLQLPSSYTPGDLGTAAGTGPLVVNQYLYEHNAQNISTLLAPPRNDPNAATNIRAHDNLYYNNLREIEDANRQIIDDGRLAIYLGRIRQLTFTQNKTQVSNITTTVTSQGVIVTEDEATPATIETGAGNAYKNTSHGGAVYINGRWAIEVGLGVNDFQGRDFVTFDGNMARNHQPELSGTASTGGSMGGALWVGGATSMLTTGRYRSNLTETKNITTYNAASLNQGGAVYMAGNAGRLMLRGGQDVVVPMQMVSNSAARGGAIYADENLGTDPNRPSPHIGGSNSANILNRNLGYNIKFQNNIAKYDGGALFAKRNYLLYGSGGVISNVIIGYSQAHLVEFSGNTAGYSGGAIAVHMRSGINTPESGYLRNVRAVFDNNRVGEVSDEALRANIRGGGAIYCLNAELQLTQGCEFRGNLAAWGNGGAIALVNPKASLAGSGTGNFQRLFCTDLDNVTFGTSPAFITGFQSVDEAFTFNPSSAYPPHVRMMTRFLDNRVTENVNRMGKGATQAGSIDVYHPGTGATSGPDATVGGVRLSENGSGLGGAIYVVDQLTANRAGRLDSVYFSRVRFQNQSAYSGAAIYSDNYDLKLVLLRSFVANNTATSNVGAQQNGITGPFLTVGTTTYNYASSDLAGTIFYGEMVGPLPYESFGRASNAIYDNNARFLIRLPDAPNTKGLLAGTTGVGFGGVDTLRGNYWGRTEANLSTRVYRYDANGNVADSIPQETFFVAGDGTQQLSFVRFPQTNLNGVGSGKTQGPFESVFRWTYTPIPLMNGANENTPATNSIPEKLLQQGRIYDLFDKGTDIKTADYANRRMSPIEDFAVGIPTSLRTFSDANQPSNNKHIKRWTRDPFVAEVDPNVGVLQTEFKGDHPIGYPLFLEAKADYSSAPDVLSNNDNRSVNETVFFVINTNTGDYIRVNMAQVDNTSETFRARVDIVPDSTNGGQAGGYPVRRNAEGLANFGTDLASILSALKRNADNEDAGALLGRKYEARNSLAELGGSGFNFVQATAGRNGTMPASNNGYETFFAGERYRAIPAKVGDQIAIVSRSALWREVGSNNAAFAGALMFRVGATTPPPIWTGNKISTQDPRTPNGLLAPPIFKNKIHVSEDRSYSRDAADASRPAGRDTIFAITVRDTNLFFDPRSILDPTKYSQIAYGWNVDANSGLARWLKADTLTAKMDSVPWWQARGHIHLKGKPSNPYVVPGGEKITVTARNYPPAYATIDSMKKAGIADSIIAKYIYLYPGFYAQQSYGSNARWLQQDTVNNGFGADTLYSFWINVTDSLPLFTNNVYACANGAGTILYANLTDKLRFKVDFNTDDETEDAAAEPTGWTFPYGRTSYAFLSLNRNDVGRDTALDNITQVRPSWMANRYIRQYANAATADPFATDFTTKGQLSIVIDSTEAVNVLSPAIRFFNSLNTDTTITIVANDGHGGITTLNKQIVVNIAPTIISNTLPTAYEDEDYNIYLTEIDSNKVIRVSDPNFGQAMSFELIYGNDARKTAGIPRDNCFTDAGTWDIANASTPMWIKINPISGMLYGTPRVKDTKLVDTTVNVTVLVTDAGGLTHVKTLTLVIKGKNHDPHITATPLVRCIEQGASFTDNAITYDIDLARKETLNLRVINPPGVTVTPNKIDGPGRDTVQLVISAAAYTATPYKTVDTVKVEVTDVNGGKPDTLVYTIRVSEKTDFTVPMVVSNNNGAFETLKWGAARAATTGDSPTLGGIGKLDSNYCEYELPPIPPTDIFDARWIVPSKNGMLNNYFPTCSNGASKIEIYKGRFQSGGVIGNSYLPIRISWKKSDVPDKSNTTLNPCGGTYFLMDGVGGSLFAVNMSNGGFRTQSPGNFELINGATEDTLVIKTDAINSFIIMWDQASPVGTSSDITEMSLDAAQPNPFNGSTKLSFNLPIATNLSLEAYDNLGNKVAVIATGSYESGSHVIEWKGQNNAGNDLPSGAYTLRLSSGAYSSVQKVVIVH